MLFMFIGSVTPFTFVVTLITVGYHMVFEKGPGRCNFSTKFALKGIRDLIVYRYLVNSQLRFLCIALTTFATLMGPVLSMGKFMIL